MFQIADVAFKKSILFFYENCSIIQSAGSKNRSLSKRWGLFDTPSWILNFRKHLIRSQCWRRHHNRLNLLKISHIGDVACRKSDFSTKSHHLAENQLFQWIVIDLMRRIRDQIFVGAAPTIDRLRKLARSRVDFYFIYSAAIKINLGHRGAGSGCRANKNLISDPTHQIDYNSLNQLILTEMMRFCWKNTFLAS